MSTPYIGEIRLFSGNFAPRGWSFCNGALLSISEYATLFALIGTTYGGDGMSTFALPDLRGRIPLHNGTGPGLTPRVLGESAGTENVTLLNTQIPSHSHPYMASTAPATNNSPDTAVLATVQPDGTDARVFYCPSDLDGVDQILDPLSVEPVGGSFPHTNLMPVLALNYIIALFGIYPSST